MADPQASTAAPPVDFIRSIVEEDVAAGRHGGRVATRFPPEPNGYLHIGHAKSICLNFGVAEERGGTCNLRFDDTNPTKEDVEYVDAIKEDVEWLGFKWTELLFASDYFEQLYQFAVELIRQGQAYVDSLTADEIREYRGTLTEPGRNSPYRDRSVDENLDLFARMRAGEFADGQHVLRAKIDMASPQPEHARPDALPDPPRDASPDGRCLVHLPDVRLRASAVGCARAHHALAVHAGVRGSSAAVRLAGQQPGVGRSGQPSAADRVRAAEPELHGHEQAQAAAARAAGRVGLGRSAACRRSAASGVAATRRNRSATSARASAWRRRRTSSTWRSSSTACARISTAARRACMAVLRPLKVVITNYPEGQVEEVDVINNPEDAAAGTRKVPFSRVLYIERDDFLEDPPKKFFRLSPGREVRLRCAYFITCKEVVKDARGEIVELRCTYDPATRGGDSPDGRRVKATLHWVSAAHAVRAVVRLYDRLFSVEDPEARGGRENVSRPPESALARGAPRLPGRAEPRRGGTRDARPVRAARLLLRRSRQPPGRARLQSHRVASRHLGKNFANRVVSKWNITSRSTISSRARSRFSTSRSSSASFPARRPRPKSSAGSSDARI